MKKRLKKISIYTSVIILIIFSLLILAINIAAYSFRSPDSALNEYYSSLNTQFKIFNTNINGYNIRYIETGLKNNDAPLLVFIHGAPGSLGDFKSYLADADLVSHFKLISVDRIGYGYSDYGKAEVDIQKQATIISNLIHKKYTSSKTIVIGYSYGGPIAAHIASKNDNINGLVMCAPLNDPENEPMKWYSRFSYTKLAMALFPDFINVASKEKMSHSKELKKILPIWPSITCPTLHIHGSQDGIAPFNANVEFSKKQLTNSDLKFIIGDDFGHMLIWNKAAMIKKGIIDMYLEIK